LGINDTPGHDVGDVVLCEVAATLRAAARGQDAVGRQGGEAFVLLLPRTGPEEANVCAERLRQAVASAKPGAGLRVVPVTASFGVAQAAAGDTWRTLFKRANEKLYHAKSDGRNRVAMAG